MTTFRLITLGSEESVAIPKGGNVPLLSHGHPVAKVTLDEDGDVAILEKTSGFGTDAQIRIEIDGQEVLEVSHLTPGQKITVDSQSYVLLKPLSIYIGSRAHTMADPSMLSLRSGVVLFAVTCVGLLFYAFRLESLPEHAVQPVSRPMPSLSEGDRPAEMVFEPLASISSAPFTFPSPSAFPTSPVPSNSKVSTAIYHKEASTGHDIPGPRHKVSGQVQVTKVPNHSPTEIRAQIDSYILEAGFDPLKAAKELRRLRDSLPSYSKGAAEADRALRAIEAQR